MKVPSKIIILKVLGLSVIKKEINMKELFQMVQFMEKEYFISKMEIDTLSNITTEKENK
jgi:hypothetical protein